ncbi:pentapeptide repeat-containing protein [Burkholderia sp. Ac-20379]|uniref:pentapeptide repeat-containing protein n=1 Tax=Burkholderia sp. Ac-20379 TaxID=2703900 RepID=UPI00197DF79B|nr:pentapeptide repeat-containing protein [Burkholderia sp. Ac-20379]MBN3724992.1 hypothetical protein [Burkholderia sp. Ac-20379]
MNRRKLPEPTLISDIDYDGKLPFGAFPDSVFRYCSFRNVEEYTGSIDGPLLSCRLIDLDMYWALFNGCLAVDSTFENCTFRGVAFASTRFLNCTFINCRFENDSLGKPCTFDNTQWIGGSATGCTGMPADAFPASKRALNAARLRAKQG